MMESSRFTSARATSCAFARKRVPIQTAHPLIQTFADRIVRIQTEQLAGRIIEISDSAFRIGNDDSLLDRIENGFEKTFLLCETQKIILHFLGTNLAEAPD